MPAHPREEEWAAFYRTFQSKTGLDLVSYKQDQLRRRILSMVDSKGVSSLDEFWGLLRGSDETVRWFLDKLAINVSELFRNADKWSEMQDKILPMLRAASPRLKIWSAGCSYGAEAYTMAMILDSKCPGAHQIVGSDIDEAALSQARRGEFSDADVRNVPPALKANYLRKEGAVWTAEAPLRRYLTFKTGNLLRDSFDTGFDLIMCRNVVIYFTEPAKEALYSKFHRALKPGGYLFVGSTERIFNSRELGFDTPLPFFYRKSLQGETVWRNAS
jgi:chemotaxis protein methyltransferase CheR